VDRQNAYDSLRQVFKRVRASGVPILAGTDTPNNCLVAGMSLSWELRRLVEFGMTPLEAIQAATIQPASAFEMEAPAVAAGREADFVMLNGNPLDDINAVADPVGVYTGGAWLDRSALMEIRAHSRFANLEDLRWKYRVILQEWLVPNLGTLYNYIRRME
jgi:imidazolonepropionase-like amidohydrolase